MDNVPTAFIEALQREGYYCTGGAHGLQVWLHVDYVGSFSRGDCVTFFNKMKPYSHIKDTKVMAIFDECGQR